MKNTLDKLFRFIGNAWSSMIWYKKIYRITTLAFNESYQFFGILFFGDKRYEHILSHMHAHCPVFHVLHVWILFLCKNRKHEFVPTMNLNYLKYIRACGWNLIGLVRVRLVHRWSNMIVQLESVLDFLSRLSRQILLCQQLKELATKNINN